MAATEHQSSKHKHHGIALIPSPSSDPRDPLRWPQSLKLLAIFSVSLFNFAGNFAGSGFSVATPVLEQEFQKSASEVNSLLTYNFLLLGLGNFVWVPLSVKFGKRSVLLFSMTIHTAALVWTSKADTFSSLLGARCVTGFAAAAGESIIPGIVADVFFLHEMASMVAIYVVLIAGATAIGPLVGSFMVARLPNTWRDFSWLCTAISLLCLILMFFFYPESTFERPGQRATDDSLAKATPQKGEDEEFSRCSFQENIRPLEVEEPLQPVKVDWLHIWWSVPLYHPSVSLLKAFVRPLALVALPTVVWASLVYGTTLAAQIIMIFAFPSFLMAPPYLFTSEGVGLMQVAALVGFSFACVGGGYISDVILSRQITKNGGVFFPEQRLVSLLPAFWISPAGCIVTAICCANQLSWVGIAFGFGMLSFGTVFNPNIAVTYVLDSFPAVAADCLVMINACKNLVAFLFLYVAVEWVNDRGWIEVYMVMFVLTTVGIVSSGALYYWRTTIQHVSARILASIKIE